MDQYDRAEPDTQWGPERPAHEQSAYLEGHQLTVVIRSAPDPCDWIVRHVWSGQSLRGTAQTPELARWIAQAVARSPHTPRHHDPETQLPAIINYPED